MLRRSAPFLLGAVMVALSGTTALADRPVRETVDPLFWSGDPWEPDKAQVKPNAASIEGFDHEVVAVSHPAQSTTTYSIKVVRFLIALWRVPWLMR